MNYEKTNVLVNFNLASINSLHQVWLVESYLSQKEEKNVQNNTITTIFR